MSDIASLHAELDHQSKFDFTHLRDSSRPLLLDELTSTHTRLANLHSEIAYLRANESKLNPDCKQERILLEGERDALIEEKFLILRLLQEAADAPAS